MPQCLWQVTHSCSHMTMKGCIDHTFHPFASNCGLVFRGTVAQVDNETWICFVKQTTQVPFCKTESTKLCHITSLIFPTASSSKARFRCGLLGLNNKTGCTPYHSHESLAMKVTHSGSMLVYNTIITIIDHLWCPILSPECLQRHKDTHISSHTPTHECTHTTHTNSLWAHAII